MPKGPQMRFYVRTLCLALAIVALSAGSATGQINFVGDGTWEAFEMNADGSQGVDLGPAVCETWASYGMIVTGVCWLWKPGVDGTTLSDLQGVYLSKQFVLGAPISGHMSVGVDDFAEVRVNGHVVGSTGSVTDLGAAQAAQADLKSFDLFPYLVEGPNTITVKAQNGPAWFTGGQCDPCTYNVNQAGVTFSGSLSYEGATPAKRTTWGSLKTHYR